MSLSGHNAHNKLYRDGVLNTYIMTHAGSWEDRYTWRPLRNAQQGEEKNAGKKLRQTPFETRTHSMHCECALGEMIIEVIICYGAVE